MTENILENKYQNIEYKKNNPFIFKNQSYNSKFHNWYNVAKFSIVILAFIFSLLALWYTTQWKSETLTKLGVNLNSFNFGADLGWNSGWDGLITNANKLSLNQWVSASSINEAMVNILIALSFVCVISTIPTLVFKNGTILSIISLAVTFISAIIVITLFIMCLNAQMNVISLYQNNDINQLKSSYDANNNRITEIDRLLATDISADEKAKLTAEKNTLTTTNTGLVSKLQAEVKRVVEGILKLTSGAVVA